MTTWSEVGERQYERLLTWLPPAVSLFDVTVQRSDRPHCIVLHILFLPTDIFLRFQRTHLGYYFSCGRIMLRKISFKRITTSFWLKIVKKSSEIDKFLLWARQWLQIYLCKWNILLEPCGFMKWKRGSYCVVWRLLRLFQRDWQTFKAENLLKRFKI